jgi:hypothetical protein
MSIVTFTAKDIIEASKKYGKGKLFKLDPTNTRSNKNTAHPTWYVPFTCISASGKYSRLNLKFNKQIISAHAAIPKKMDKEKASYVTVSYRELTSDDLSITQYPEDKHNELLRGNKEFVQALNIIADEYMEMVKTQLMSKENKALNKYKIKEKKINCYRQSLRERLPGEESHKKSSENEEDEEDDDNDKISLEHPIFRIRIKSDTKTRKLGYRSDGKSHQYVVFDSNKVNKEKGTKYVPAKLKQNGKLVDLTLDNVGSFITYMSLTAGMINFECVCLSQTGISLICSFLDLHVAHHPKMKREQMSTEDIEEMHSFGIPNNGDDVEVEEPDENDNDDKPKSKRNVGKSKYLDSDEEEPLDNQMDSDEPEEKSTSDVDEPETKSKTKLKKSESKVADLVEEEPTVKTEAKNKPKKTESNEEKPKSKKSIEESDEPIKVKKAATPPKVQNKLDEEPEDNEVELDVKTKKVPTPIKKVVKPEPEDEVEDVDEDADVEVEEPEVKPKKVLTPIKKVVKPEPEEVDAEVDDVEVEEPEVKSKIAKKASPKKVSKSTKKVIDDEPEEADIKSEEEPEEESKPLVKKKIVAKPKIVKKTK